MHLKSLTWFEYTLLALVTALFLWWIYPGDLATRDDADETASSTKLVLFPEVDIEARSAYVYDAREGRALYEKDPELQWPLASLAKVMVALAAAEIMPDYALVRITADDVREEGDTGLLLDEEWNIRRLVDYSLIVSSNDGVRAIASVAGAHIGATATTTAEQAFIGRMNARARELGLSETYFLNQSGLDVTKSLGGAYGSARDMAILVDHVLKTDPHILEATGLAKTSIDSKNASHPAANTNKSIANIPNVLASKTGYTELSGGNVVVAWNAGLDRPIVISVLGSSYEGRFADLDKLVAATLEYLEKTAQ